MVAYTVLDFGAPYPWYATVAFPLLAVAASITVDRLVTWSMAGSRPRVVECAVVAGAALVLIASALPGTVESMRMVVGSVPERTARLLDDTRRAAGIDVSRRARPEDVVRTCFGWVAYEAAAHAIDEVCPLNTRQHVADAVWYVGSSGPDGIHPAPPAGFTAVSRFVRIGPDGTTVSSTVFHRSDRPT